MSATIHPTAVIDPAAQIGDGCEIGPYCVIGAGVELGADCWLQHHVSLGGPSKIGRGNQFFAFSSVGQRTQDLKYAGEPTYLAVGDGNTFREFVTVHRGTAPGSITRVGSRGNFLAYAHIAHDCVIGNHCVMSNGTMLAGHVIVEDHVIIGGYGGVHQFCRLGAYAMLSATAKLVQDLPPFFIADGTPAVVRAYNKVGLERNGHTAEQLDRVKQIFRILYRDGLNRSQALEKLSAHADAATAEFQRVIAFAKKSERGIAPGA